MLATAKATAEKAMLAIFVAFAAHTRA